MGKSKFTFKIEDLDDVDECGSVSSEESPEVNVIKVDTPVV